MVYIHTPFCRSFCTYCDFYSELCPGSVSQEVQSALFSSYKVNVLDEIASRVASPSAPDTIYFGGGTPSVLPLDVVEAIVAALRERGVLGADEFTFEVNPDDIVRRGEDYVRSLLGLGVSRISMGVQSFDDGILRWMNRRHSASDAEEAVAILRRAGVRNLSIDLIFGLSQLSDEEWLATLEKALQMHPEHISAYQLSIEEGSALGRMVQAGQYEEASDELCRRQYDLLCEKLCAAGYHHYEISNWALLGREAVHNSAYWSRVPYIGLGPGAHSFELVPVSTDAFLQVRSWNSEGIESYSPESETLGEKEAVEETIMLALRTSSGISESFLRAHSATAVNALLSEGALVRMGERLRIPEDHFFVSDDIISRLI